MIGVLSLIGTISLFMCYQYSPDFALPASIYIGCILIAHAIAKNKKP